MNQHFDLIVIGAGMAGVAAANKCAAQGWEVAIVDSLPYGGTCALRGCDPKKILRRGAEIIDSARLLSGKGIDSDGLSINWADLMKHKHGFTDPVPQSMEEGLSRSGVTTLHGRAKFTGARQLEIGGTAYDADRFLVATGARPRPLEFPGHEHLIDSTDFLDLEEVPSRILFVGGGFISFEFAHIAVRAGSAAIIIDRGERPLKGFDPDLVELLVDHGREVGIDLRRRTSIVNLHQSDTGYQVTLEHGGAQLGRARHPRRRPPPEHDQPGRLGRRRLRRHRRDAAHTGRGFGGEGRCVQHDQGRHHDPGLRRCANGGLHHPRAHPSRRAGVRSARGGHRPRRPLLRHQRLVLQLPDRGNHRGGEDPHRPVDRPDRRSPPART